MENQSLNETHNLTGTSGLSGLPTCPLKLQPIRVKALMAMYASDEEESEEKGKESDSDSECDDIQPLPEDDEEDEGVPEVQNLPAKESGEKRDNGTEAAKEEIVIRQFEDQCRLPNESLSRQERIRASEHHRTSKSFTNNPIIDEHFHTRLENHRSTSLPSESTSDSYSVGSSAPKLLAESNRDSSTKFKAPDTLHSTNNKFSYSQVSAQLESAKHSSRYSAHSKFELSESTYLSSERHLHTTNVAPQSELPTTSTSAIVHASTAKPTYETPRSPNFSSENHLYVSNVAPQVEFPATSAAAVVHAPTASHLITDTPLKNNPPVGSMRPTPSVSHRSMFQTPQNLRFHQQEYSKNNVHTPATIFGNWSQKHMAQTPLQSRSTFPTSDNARGAAAPSILASQHPAPVASAATGSTHEASRYRGTEEKKVRRPLAETMMSSINHPQHLQSEKPPTEYSVESSVASSRHHESPDNPQGRSILEIMKDTSSKLAQQSQQHGRHETKENRQPPPLIDKLPTREEEQGGRGNFESIKESIGLRSSVSNENRSEAARHRVEINDIPISSRGVRSSGMAARKSTALPATIDKDKDAPNKKVNVQASIPSTIRRMNHGETMMVKGKEYLILGSLGEGMSCHVLRVQDLSNFELRAIKVVNLSRMDKDCAQGCLQEISMLNKLQAPCVVKMFDFEIKFPIVHVVMEMGDTDFKSLLNSMTQNNRLPLAMILYYWMEMLTAVKHIHDNGVIHSDLKPANFLLVRGRLKLIDFGIASSINPDMTSVVKNSPIGTLNYISPEAVMDISSGGSGGDSPSQNVKYKITFKSDVWSLGCILYSLVYGYTPFHKIRVQWAKIQAITNPNPKISFAFPPGTNVEPPPPILIDVMRKCLQHDPKARPTVSQLLQIPYIPTKPSSRTSAPEIPSNIVVKIKNSLTDDEWQKFIEVMEARVNHS